jgi:UrcA family protein
MTALRNARSMIPVSMAAPMAARFAASAAIAVAGLMSAGTAVAATPAATRSVEVAQVIVQYGDLNLDTERGTVVLQRRLEAAAHRVCGRPDARDLRRATQARECRQDAIARAVKDVGSPRLAERHAAGRSRALRG